MKRKNVLLISILSIFLFIVPQNVSAAIERDNPCVYTFNVSPPGTTQSTSCILTLLPNSKNNSSDETFNHGGNASAWIDLQDDFSKELLYDGKECKTNLDVYIGSGCYQSGDSNCEVMILKEQRSQEEITYCNSNPNSPNCQGKQTISLNEADTKKAATIASNSSSDSATTKCTKIKISNSEEKTKDDAIDYINELAKNYATSIRKYNTYVGEDSGAEFFDNCSSKMISEYRGFNDDMILAQNNWAVVIKYVRENNSDCSNLNNILTVGITNIQDTVIAKYKEVNSAWEKTYQNGCPQEKQDQIQKIDSGLKIDNTQPRDDLPSMPEFDIGDGNATCNTLIGRDALDLIKSVVTWFRIAVPILLIILGMLDFGKVVMLNDKDIMQKAISTFVKRCIIAIIIFFVPLIIEILLTSAGILTKDALCIF